MNLYGERIAADVLAKFQRSRSEMELLGEVMLEVLISSESQTFADDLTLGSVLSERNEVDANESLAAWTLTRLLAIEGEVARLQEIDFEPQVLYPAIAVPPELLTSKPAQEDSLRRETPRNKVTRGATLGNLARNLQGSSDEGSFAQPGVSYLNQTGGRSKSTK